MWKNFIDNGGTLTFQIYSCDVGDLSQDGSPLAMELSERHPGLTVYAPSAYVSIKGGTKLYIMDKMVFGINFLTVNL